MRNLLLILSLSVMPGCLSAHKTIDPSQVQQSSTDVNAHASEIGSILTSTVNSQVVSGGLGWALLAGTVAFLGFFFFKFLRRRRRR